MLAYPLPVPRIQTRRDALRLFAGLKEAEREMLGIAYLGSERMLLGLRHVAGVTDAVAVPMTRIVRDALFFSASAVMIAHNHPDGDPRPSPADLSLTRRLAQGLGALDLTLLDHLILAGSAVLSLREMGLV